MLRDWKLLILILALVAGAALAVYLFAKEDVQNLGEVITGNGVEILVEGEPTEENLLLSLFNSAIDFDSQMAGIRAKGFEGEYFIALVAGLSSSQNSITMEMEFPVDGGFETEEKVAAADCSAESTAVLGADDMELLAESGDIFDWAEVGDRIVSYCLDSACGSIGQECVLMKTRVVE